ncbi:MAG: hypothetical protein H0U01_01800 [Acidimicrobiia bacterium]|jgi:hypothetical protein|nr:hypothetical protein [Acidimicrobiia bacterium]
MIAHGDHVFLARQSSEVAVQEDQQRPSAVVAEAELNPFVIDESDVGEQVALADHELSGHVRFM